MRQRLLFAFLIALLWPLPARALDPTKRITQYAHASWRGQDGAFTSVPNTIEQAPDGYIWIGTSEGIFRFDGVRFVHWRPTTGHTALLGVVRSLCLLKSPFLLRQLMLRPDHGYASRR